MDDLQDLSARLFVKLYTSLLDDEDMVEQSYAAVGVYAVGLLLSKHTAADGRVPIKLFERDAALRPGTPLEEALEELDSAGLVTVADGHVNVRSWSKYNALAADIVAAQNAKRESGRRYAHERWHEGDYRACPRCHKGVSPGQCQDDGSPMGAPVGTQWAPNAQSESQSHSQSDSQSDSDDHQMGGPLGDPSTSPDGLGFELGLDSIDVAAADRLIEILGYLGEPSTSGERRYVARARRRGWSIEHLEDLAHEAAGKTDVDDVRQWLGGCLRKRANTDPDPDQRAAADDGNPLASITGDEAFPAADEGWDTPEVTKSGLAAARSALPSNPSPSDEASDP